MRQFDHSRTEFVELLFDRINDAFASRHDRNYLSQMLKKPQSRIDAESPLTVQPDNRPHFQDNTNIEFPKR